MEWWMPFAVMAAALLASLIAPMPRPRTGLAGEDEAVPAGARGAYSFQNLDDLDDDDIGLESEPPRDDVDLDEEPPRRERAEPPRSTPRMAPPPPPEREPEPPPARAAERARGRPVTDRPGIDAPSYFRDPTALAEWPQAEVVQETVQAFLDRWGGGRAATTFRTVEVVPASNERAFAFILAVEPERRGGETSILARVCVPSENASRPCRFWATKYFDHMGERFREDVAKTPQHSRGIITVRDVSAAEGDRAAVALDYEVALRGDPYDDIRAEDVGQYKNLLNIMRMFA